MKILRIVLLGVLVAVVARTQDPQIHRYYIVGSRQGFVVALADSPDSAPSQWVRLPLQRPPTPMAQAMADAAFAKLCEVPWVVACTHIPEQSSGFSDLWILESPSGWKPATRLTLGGCLITYGLVTSPLHMGEPLQGVYDQAFVNAAVQKTGWYEHLDDNQGRDAWIIGMGRQVQYLELQRAIAQQRQERHPERVQPENQRITLPDDTQSMTGEQRDDSARARARDRGIDYDPKTMMVRKLQD